MTKTNYNGWYNYETWNVKLWMDNDQGSSEYWNGRARELIEDHSEDDDLSEAVSKLADEIETQHREEMPEVSGTYSDLLGAALLEVNWHEIANSLIEDNKE
jgi:hypothetical protein